MNLRLDRSDVIDLKWALTVAALKVRREAKLRRNGGPTMKPYRAMLREQGASFEALAREVRRQLDDADRLGVS